MAFDSLQKSESATVPPLTRKPRVQAELATAETIIPKKIRERMEDMRDPIYGLIKKKVALVCPNGDPRDREDLIQKVSSIVWEKADRFNGNEDDLGGWIYVIAKNAFIMDLRKVRGSDYTRKELRSLNDTLLKFNSLSTEQEMVDNLGNKELWNFLNRVLSRGEFELLEKRYKEGYKTKEIAKQSGIAESQVKSQLQLLVEKIRRRVKKYKLEDPR